MPSEAVQHIELGTKQLKLVPDLPCNANLFWWDLFVLDISTYALIAVYYIKQHLSNALLNIVN